MDEAELMEVLNDISLTLECYLFAQTLLLTMIYLYLPKKGKEDGTD